MIISSSPAIYTKANVLEGAASERMTGWVAELSWALQHLKGRSTQVVLQLLLDLAWNAHVSHNFCLIKQRLAANFMTL